MLRPTSGDPWGVEQHHWNTGAKENQQLNPGEAYKEISEDEKSVVNVHCNHLALKFSVCVKERQDRLPSMYWLPKLHTKRKTKKRIKHDLLQTQVLVLQLNFLNY